MFDSDRLEAALSKVRGDLLAQRTEEGHWVGQLSSSALSTATAVSAMVLMQRYDPVGAWGGLLDPSRPVHVAELIFDGLRWLCRNQNDDGGWGDTPESLSNIATTMLVVSAFHLTGVPDDHADHLGRAEKYIQDNDGIAGIKKRYGKDHTFAVPILTNAALAGLVPWSKVPSLPFEWACLPQRWYRFARMQVVSYALPALIAIGLAGYHHKTPWNPLSRFVRKASFEPSLRLLEQIQPESGGFLEAIPLTAFVVMSLASIGRADHPVARQGLEFLLRSARADGGFPIDTNLATWVTTLSVTALSAAGEDLPTSLGDDCLDWLLDCQGTQQHPSTGAAAGGWGWSDLSGSVPDADDTSGALLALAAWRDAPACPPSTRARLLEASERGVEWLLDLQNSDGGWPTFCRGWGRLPFDRSGADLTAHALRALETWRVVGNGERLHQAVSRGFDYLAKRQQDDGSWLPLWFGNQYHRRDENPVYGTARVLLAYRDWNRLRDLPAEQGLDWLLSVQGERGGWGEVSGQEGSPQHCSIEETAIALESLLSSIETPDRKKGALRGLDWLIQAVENGEYRVSRPIGFYFAKLWYDERLYPLIFSVAALGAGRSSAPRLGPKSPP